MEFPPLIWLAFPSQLAVLLAFMALLDCIRIILSKYSWILLSRTFNGYQKKSRSRGNTDGMVPMVILKSILEKISGGGQDSQVLLYENSIHYFYSCTSNEGFSHVQNYVKRRYFKLRLLCFGRFLSLSPSRKDFAYSNSLRMTSTRTLNIPRTPRLTYNWVDWISAVPSPFLTRGISSFTSWPFKACDSRYHRVHL